MKHRGTQHDACQMWWSVLSLIKFVVTSPSPTSNAITTIINITYHQNHHQHCARQHHYYHYSLYHHHHGHHPVRGKRASRRLNDWAKEMDVKVLVNQAYMNKRCFCYYTLHDYNYFGLHFLTGEYGQNRRMDKSIYVTCNLLHLPGWILVLPCCEILTACSDFRAGSMSGEAWGVAQRWWLWPLWY